MEGTPSGRSGCSGRQPDLPEARKVVSPRLSLAPRRNGPRFSGTSCPFRTHASGNRGRLELCFGAPSISRHVRRRLAWLLAASPDDSLRNGELALKLATQTVFNGQPDEVPALRTLAAAYAEVGRFDQAAKLARHAAELAGKRNLEKLSKRISQELALYSTGRPVRISGTSDTGSQ